MNEASTTGARSDRANSGIGAVLTALIILMLLVPLVAPSLRQLSFIMMSQGMVALGVMILLRAGLVSFGHGLYFTCGAYAVAFGSHSGLGDLLVLLPMAMVLSAALGAVLALLLVRYRDIFFAMLNLAFAMVGYALLLKLYNLTGGSDGVSVQQPTLAGVELGTKTYGWTLYAVSAVALALAAGVVKLYLRSPLGHALGAVKTNETRLEYLGISSRRVLFAAYVLSAALAGLGGAFAALITAHVTPDGAYWTKSAEFIFIVVLGGAGSVAGPVAGAVLYELIRSVATAYAVNAWQLIMGLTLLAIMLFAPDGIWGMGNRLLGRLRRRN